MLEFHLIDTFTWTVTAYCIVELNYKFSIGFNGGFPLVRPQHRPWSPFTGTPSQVRLSQTSRPAAVPTRPLAVVVPLFLSLSHTLVNVNANANANASAHSTLCLETRLSATNPTQQNKQIIQPAKPTEDGPPTAPKPSQS